MPSLLMHDTIAGARLGSGFFRWKGEGRGGVRPIESPVNAIIL
jgi:hypothetical protein